MLREEAVQCQLLFVRHPHLDVGQVLSQKHGIYVSIGEGTFET